MSEYQEITNFFEERGPEDIERFVDKNLDISQQVFALLDEKGWNQSDLAKALDKSDAEISKWLSGTHNLTLRSIAKMEAALKADIIVTPKKAKDKYKQIAYVTLKVRAKINEVIPDQTEYKESGNPKWHGKQILQVA
ncbi:MAG TPA: helix-turn-helix transcriptional regulator [Flavilitoribacter sp.]|nr:helix-turn-helix transcriptional regulator [Flavilitoribacter sp.]HMQ88508.1 helix-turn-helix transcriptional regulator [Flavilitoribacter sp.]